jgi:hypothetical protein
MNCVSGGQMTHFGGLIIRDGAPAPAAPGLLYWPESCGGTSWQKSCSVVSTYEKHVDPRNTSSAESGGPAVAYDRALQRRRAVALARHFREAEGLSIAEIADRLGRSPATTKAYFYDPTEEKARAIKGCYLGGVPGCGAYT